MKKPGGPAAQDRASLVRQFTVDELASVVNRSEGVRTCHKARTCHEERGGGTDGG